LSDRIASLQRNQPIGASSEMKRSKWNLGILGFKQNKDRCSEAKLIVAMNELKLKNDDDILNERLEKLQCFKPPLYFNENSTFQNFVSKNGTKKMKHYEAVSELFTTERSFLVNHLLVILQVFLEPLQHLQCDGHLLHVDARLIFGNIEELCSVTIEFCETLLDVVSNYEDMNCCGEKIYSAFETFESTLCPPYQRYFYAYENSLMYSEELKTDIDFIAFIQWCEQNSRCKRLRLADFLISPLQHLTKYPLLLRHIIEYTDDTIQTTSLERTAFSVQESLKALEGKVSCLTHLQLLQDLQNTISWPPVYELDTKAVIPESLRQSLRYQPCRNLLPSFKRRLELEGALSVIENGKCLEVYVFLFDDLLLLTKPQKRKRRCTEIPTSLKRHPYLKDGTLLSVYRQPIALDRFTVYDLGTNQLNSGLNHKKSFVIVQENRFQQMVSIVTLEAASGDEKKIWLGALAKTAAEWMENHVFKVSSTSENKSLSSPFAYRTSKTDDKMKMFSTCGRDTEEKEGLSKVNGTKQQNSHSFEYFAALNNRRSENASIETSDPK